MSSDFDPLTFRRFIDLLEVYRNRNLFGPHIDGVEVTQGIQYYQASRHLTDSSDRGADNSVTFAAYKPAWVRVYVRPGIGSFTSTLTGQLEVERKRLTLSTTWDPVTILNPVSPGTVVARFYSDYATERSNIASTLNFIIPLDVMAYTLRLRVKIWLPTGSSANPIDTHELIVDATLLQTLSLRGVMISYLGPDPTTGTVPPPNLNLPAPTVADLQNTAAWTLTTNPVQSQGVFSSAGTMQWTTPLTGVATTPGGCSTQWINLNAAVAQVKTNDGNRNDVIYYGLLPAGTPIQNVGGCESSGVSTGPNGRQVVMAHEVGHGAGLQHGPCGTPGDPNYPAYEPYDPINTPRASLGEYGLDINNGAIHLPAEKDYMSYCGPNWISLYHNGKLTNNSKFSPKRLGKLGLPELVDPFLWPWEYIPDPPPFHVNPGELRVKAQKVISIIGVMSDEQELQVQNVMRVTALPEISNGTPTRLVAELMGEEGRVVASAPVLRLESHGQGCCKCKEKEDDRGPFVFQAMIPEIEPGSALRIVRKEEDDKPSKELWVRKAPARQPLIGSFKINISNDSGLAKWEAEFASQNGEFSLQFTKDKGRSWNGLAVGIRENKYTFGLADLPSGLVIFRLLAHDGFFTTAIESEPVEIPSQAPNVSILHPQESSYLVEGFPMRLWASISGSQAGTDVSYDWIIDGVESAHGRDTWITAPKSGKHRCILLGRLDGKTIEKDVSFDTVGQGLTDNDDGTNMQK